MRGVKRLLKKLTALVVMVAVLMAALPMAGFEGVFDFIYVKVYAEETADPFDTSKLTVVSSGEHYGAAWTWYSNGLLWVEDDSSGDTTKKDNRYSVGTITGAADFTVEKSDIQYIYWNITAPKDSGGAFNSCRNLVEVRLGDKFINTSSNITDISSMFYQCPKLTKCNLTNLDTSNATDMSWMFSHSGFTSLDLNLYDTSKVTDMSYMFYGCTSLKSLNIASWNTSNVTDMSWMFVRCDVLENVDVSNFNTRKVIDMSNMFGGCYALKALDVSGFDTSNVIDMSYMFDSSSSLTTLDLSNFDMTKVEEADNFIANCTYLHIIRTPVNYKLNEYVMDGTWYELKNYSTLDKTEGYKKLPTDLAGSILLIREFTHHHENVVNGVGLCTVCGLNIMYGDNDDNGKINVADAVMLKKYLAGDDTTTINLGAANVNVDSKISVDDAVKLMKKLAGMDVQLGVEETQ